jgi:hypothetical protein
VGAAETEFFQHYSPNTERIRQVCRPHGPWQATAFTWVQVSRRHAPPVSRLFTSGGLVVTAHAAPTTPGLTATQATTCIQTAMAAQSGMVTKVEVEEKSKQQLCEVGIVDTNGKKHRVQIDVGTNQVVKAK